MTALPAENNIGGIMNKKRTLLVLMGASLLPLMARGQGINTSAIDEALGRPGQKIGDVVQSGFSEKRFARNYAWPDH